MTKKYLILFCFQLLVISLMAQSSESPKRNYFIGGSLSYAFPRSELGQNIGNQDNLGSIGIPRNSGLVIDAIFQSKRDTWLYMGFDYALFFLDVEGGDFNTYNLTTSNYYSTLHYKIRAEYDFDEYVKPYVEALLGGQVFFTQTLRQDLIGNEAYQGRYMETGDWGLSFGVEVGTQVRVARGVYFDVSAAYLRGTPTEFLVRLDNPPFGREPIDSFDRVTASIDVLRLKVGLQFGRSKQND